MRIIADNVSRRNLDAFNTVERGAEQVHLKDGVLTAGTSWKGRLVSVLETFGVFKEYCTQFRSGEAKTNRHAAEILWRALVTRYGVENARQGLDNLSPRFRGMDVLKARQGLIRYGEVDKTAHLTCGEVRSLLDRTKAMSISNPLSSPPSQAYTLKNAFAELQPLLLNALDRTQQQLDNLRSQSRKDKPKDDSNVPRASAEEQLYYAGAVKHSEALTPALLNHQRAKVFMAEPANLKGLMGDMKVDLDKLKPGRVEYITSRVFKEIRESHTDKEMSRTEIRSLVREALDESFKHRVSWNRMQALRMGVGKKLSGERSKFNTEVETLVNLSRSNASKVLTEPFVRSIAEHEGYALNDEQVTNIISKALNTVEQAVRDQRIEMDKQDYRVIVKNIVAGD